MPEKELMEIEENAKFIVSGYAFFRKPDGFIGILNLEHPDCAMVVNDAGEIIETNMDSIEQKIVHDLCERNLQFMED
ncbi:MAG: toxin-antitoxin system, toxin component [Clostridia bacterium]|nr:toxin-antitoxin system, toxin component [Clostridia bacterium]